MSLLMDALKKAELAKRKAQPDNTSASAAKPQTSNIDYQQPATSHSNPELLPNLPEHLELLDGEFDTGSAAPVTNVSAVPPPASLASPAATLALQADDPTVSFTRQTSTASAAATPPANEREAVQNLFDTKQTAPSRKLFGIAIGVATLCAVAAVGLYFWTELQPKSGLQASSSLITTPPAKPIAAPGVAPLPATPVITGLTLPNENVEPIVRETPVAEVTEPLALKTATAPARKLFQVSTTAPLSTQVLDRAYDALARGDNAAAKSAYTQALANDPKNADALSGLAVIAQRAGNSEMAADYYLQMLDADPKNTIAMAGLMNLQSQMNPAVAETRLKQALASQPDSAALNFSLGNIYSRTKRWNDAQQAYFKAMASDPGNPDYLFNLAVSLDQLRQPRLAEKYYVQAIAAAEARPAAFDKARVNERLQKLQQQP